MMTSSSGSLWRVGMMGMFGYGRVWMMTIQSSSLSGKRRTLSHSRLAIYLLVVFLGSVIMFDWFLLRPFVMNRLSEEDWDVFVPPQNGKLVTASSNNTVQIHTFPDGDPDGILTRFTTNATHVVFNSSGSRVAAGSRYLWSLLENRTRSKGKGIALFCPKVAKCAYLHI